MNATAAKHTRRDLRRAMGPEALDLVGHQAQAIRTLQEWTLMTTRLLEVQTDRLDLLRQDVDVLCAVSARSFLGRLRWLVTGR